MSQGYWWHITDSTGNVQRSDDEREVVHREINFEMEAAGDGRTLYTRIVPYNTPVEVADPPFFEPYLEEWKPGVFDKQLRAANRVDVLLNFEHEKGIAGIVGRGTELRSKPDGLHGTFRLLGSQGGEVARELVAEKVLTGMSLEATLIKSSRSPSGVVERHEARLRNVAICRKPAFPGAEVLAVRSESEPEPEPEPSPDEPAPEPDPVEPNVIVVPELVVRDEITGLLEKVGVTTTPKMEVVRGSWDGSSDRYDDDQYLNACLIVREGDGPVKERCSLPILEPNGELNVTALSIAARLLPQTTGVTNVQRAEAARRLVRLYRLVGLETPNQILDAARR